MISIQRPAPNFTRVQVGLLTLWFSYDTIVAFRHKETFAVQQNDWGPTTGKHLNSIDGGAVKKRLPREEFRTYLEDALSECHLL